MKRTILGVFVSLLAISLVFGSQASSVKASSTYPSGSLVNDGGTIYFISGTTKVPFTNWQSFVGLGYSLNQVVNGDTSGYTASSSYMISTANAAHPWGSWVSHNGTVYYSTQSGLVGVPTPAVFTANGGQWKFVVPANSYDLATIASSTTLANNDSRVYSPTNPTPAQTPVISAPAITSISPTSSPAGTQVTIIGTGFTATGNSIVNLQDGTVWASSLSSNNGTNLIFTVPSTVVSASGNSQTLNPGAYMLSVKNSSGNSNTANPFGISFVITTASTSTSLALTSISPTSSPAGTQVTIIGTGFTATNNTVTCTVDGSDWAYNLSSNNGTSLTFTIPDNSTGYFYLKGSGNYPLNVRNANGVSNTVNFTVTGSNLNNFEATNTSIYPLIAVAGQTHQRIASFILTAPISDAVTVNTLSFEVSPSAVILNNAAFYVNGQKIASFDTSPINSSDKTPVISLPAPLNQPLVVAAGSSRVIDIYADVSSSTPVGSSLNFILNPGQVTGNTTNTTYYYQGTGSMSLTVTQ